MTQALKYVSSFLAQSFVLLWCQFSDNDNLSEWVCGTLIEHDISILTEINVSFRYIMQHQLLSGMSMTGFLYKR